jgi:ribosome-associated toxin RatA of RatAB toxin-antitoxin module
MGLAAKEKGSCRRAARAALVGGLLLASSGFLAAGARAADFELTPGEAARVDRGETVIRASLDAAQRGGTVRAAMLIDAPPEVVFQAMTHCDDAMRYVPHLRACRVLPQSIAPGTHLVEHEIDFGWYAPRLNYVFRADVVTDRSIAFRQVRGDFKANQGVWEFEPEPGNGGRTLLRYRVEIDPPAYVPSWLARSIFKRDLPRMLAQLRRHCEAGQQGETHANISAY